MCNSIFKTTPIYARCNALKRLELLENMKKIEESNIKPWIVGGDFYVIANEEEKLKGLFFT